MKSVMLAQKVTEPKALRYPLYGSPKIDGIRCIIRNGRPLTRKLLDIPNLYLRTLLAELPDGLDGELVVEGDQKIGDFHATQSAVMSHAGAPDVSFLIFDYAPPGEEYMPFRERLLALTTLAPDLPEWAMVLPQRLIPNVSALEAYEAEQLADGHEGICLRCPGGFYKSGRSTLKQQWLLKIKRFEDAEAPVLNYFELQHNDNEATLDNLGHTKRSHAQAGKRPGGILGGLTCLDVRSGNSFNIGSGFTHQQRVDLWACRDTLAGRWVTYKYQPHGTKDRPRTPIFLRFRDARDFDPPIL